ncbi:tetratricopeptide repeat-containing protein [Aeromicrobium yanjiei]|uniref:DUF4071 domain-containing protein n=1 Tax=Aeromicrobium yanjiei TaxID=2662028 RepID=A0A5Q2MF94_9ACTN|nr:tetratricopeptide repeat-containing protein [Aeromicrobium yanjiei]QGG41308.1 hypothetical protein GEV26_07975 [Aeromicrobium yanjiei]
MESLKPRVVVGALASGSDIIIAEAAMMEGVRVDASLPFSVDQFRTTSVATRGHRWSARYDALVTKLGADLRTGDESADDEAVYARHNETLIRRAFELAEQGERVWVLSVRQAPDPENPTVTDDLVNRALLRGCLSLDLDPLAARKRAFIAMPYGHKFDPATKTTYDCDETFNKVYRPVLEDSDLDWTRADLQTDSGLIHVGMIDDLANSDVVIADLATANFNVAYELGLRHVFARQSTVLVNPVHVDSLAGYPPFDVGGIRAVTFKRGNQLSDDEAEQGIAKLRAVLGQVIRNASADSPVHEWFDIDRLTPPILQRTNIPAVLSHELEIRNKVKQALRSSSATNMLAAVRLVEQSDALSDDARAGLRLELGSGLMNESDYVSAAAVLDAAQPSDDSPTHKRWLQKTAMAKRRVGESAEDTSERDRQWSEAEHLLSRGLELGYGDAETYGIYGGLIKRRLTHTRATLSEVAATALFDSMREQYRRGFETDPSYYLGLNYVMSLRLALQHSDDKNPADQSALTEALVVTKFLTRLARDEDPTDFWVAATEAELALHEALLGGADLSAVVAAYARAALLGRPDHIRSANDQLQFLREWGDPPETISRVAAALETHQT